MVATTYSFLSGIEPYRHQMGTLEMTESASEHAHLTVTERHAPSSATRAKLEELATLTHDWDTYGAQPIERRAITTAWELLYALASRLDTHRAEPYFIAPLPYGGVQLEWRNGACEIEVEVAPNGTFAYLLIRSVGSDRVFDEVNVADMREVLDRIEEMHAA